MLCTHEKKGGLFRFLYQISCLFLIPFFITWSIYSLKMPLSKTSLCLLHLHVLPGIHDILNVNCGLIWSLGSSQLWLGFMPAQLDQLSVQWTDLPSLFCSQGPLLYLAWLAIALFGLLWPKGWVWQHSSILAAEASSLPTWWPQDLVDSGPIANWGWSAPKPSLLGRVGLEKESGPSSWPENRIAQADMLI